MGLELYKRYRPKALGEVVGQSDAVKVLSAFGGDKVPQVILFSGPSGCGKTTLARIMAEAVKCGPRDLCEVNAADDRGIELVRTVRRAMTKKPISGESNVWIIDECHRLTIDASSAFLKILEDTPRRTYFFLCTTDPAKLQKAVITRATQVRVKAVADDAMTGLLARVVAKEKLKVSGDVIEKIVGVAGGSPRQALVILNQVMGVAGEASQSELVQKSEFSTDAISVARALMNPKASWPDVKGLLRNLADDVEGARRLILAYFANALVGTGRVDAKRAAFVLDRFQGHFYDSGFAGLVLACFEVVTALR